MLDNKVNYSSTCFPVQLLGSTSAYKRFFDTGELSTKFEAKLTGGAQVGLNAFDLVELDLNAGAAHLLSCEYEQQLSDRGPEKTDFWYFGKGNEAKFEQGAAIGIYGTSYGKEREFIGNLGPGGGYRDLKDKNKLSILYLFNGEVAEEHATRNINMRESVDIPLSIKAGIGIDLKISFGYNTELIKQ